jgi:hypothetical protein
LSAVNDPTDQNHLYEQDGESKETQTSQPKSNHRLSLFDARFYR